MPQLPLLSTFSGLVPRAQCPSRRRPPLMPRSTHFQQAHIALFGMEPVERSIEGEIKTVQCRFCIQFGRERREGPAVKRARTQNTALFCFPFRLELFRKHLVGQHTEEWSRFQSLSSEGRESFFDASVAVSGIQRYLDIDSDSLHFVITSPEIVSTIVTFSTSAAALWRTCYCVPQHHLGGERLILGAVGERQCTNESHKLVPRRRHARNTRCDVASASC